MQGRGEDGDGAGGAPAAQRHHQGPAARRPRRRQATARCEKSGETRHRSETEKDVVGVMEFGKNLF